MKKTPKKKIPGTAEIESRLEKSKQALRSSFESIFDRYDQNFDAESDIIDFETGTIVEDRGHVRGLPVRGRNTVLWDGEGDKDATPPGGNEAVEDSSVAGLFDGNNFR